MRAGMVAAHCAGMTHERATARARALRAARSMSIAAALALTPVGCSMSHDTGTDAGARDSGVIIADGAAPDTGVRVDSGVDAGPADSGIDSGVDSGVADSGVDSGVDAGECPDPGTLGECCAPITQECCEASGWGFWDELAECCSIWLEGPLTPPSAPV